METYLSSIQSVEITMPCHLGFHIRVVARFVLFVRQFHSAIRVKKGKLVADGKNILGLLLLAAAWKSKLTVEAEGDDAEKTIRGVESFFRCEH